MVNAALPLAVFLREPYLSALRDEAAKRRMGEGEAASRLLERALEPFLADDIGKQARAERQLLELVSTITADQLGIGSWDEHLTLTVFNRLALEHRSLYDTATSVGDTARINRRVGRRIKEVAGAEVKLSADGNPVLVKVPRRSPSLIRRYTLLVPGRGGEVSSPKAGAVA